jgi:DNA polymerase/3'-5' exonuclease PolX
LFDYSSSIKYYIMTTINDTNQEIAGILSLLANYYTMAGDTYRARAFNTAANVVAEAPYVITSGKQAQKELQGIGKSSADIIDEYLNTGSVQRLKELEAQFVEQRRVIDYFRSFYGIGPSKAIEFYNQGFRTLADIWYKAQLTPAQQLGILWREHINLRIDRTEMDLINQRIGEVLNPHRIKWEIAGSYRRGEPSSGDVDVLVESRLGVDMDYIIELLRPLIAATLAHGTSMYRGILRLGPEFNGHRIDIRIINPNNYAAALMYFTGSQQFNILMRNRAIELGLSLSEYGVTGQAGLPAINSEQDIFNVLRVRYMAPVERIKTLATLPTY